MSKVCDSISVLSPPPPPLPNLNVIIAAKTTVVNSEESENDVLTYILKLYKNVVPESYLLPDTFKYTHLNPLIQDGPTCGLVALSMISSVSPCVCEVPYLFDLACRRGFTKKGEMFSALNMARLADEVLNREFDVIHYQGGIMERKEELLENILSGHLYLIPYDADKNHTPSNLRGLKAHWAILCGVVVDSSNFFVIARQSKSKHVALWHLDNLHNSNMNLEKIAIDKAESSEYVTEDIKVTLAGSYILFKRR